MPDRGTAAGRASSAVNPERLVVVGASLAGLRAVEAARKSGFTGSITLIGAEPHLPYDRPPLSKRFLEADGSPEPVFRDEAVLRDELGIQLVLGEPATAVDAESKAVTVGPEGYRYDALVLAPGLSARTLPGCTGLSGIHLLRTLDDARALCAAMSTARRLVVVGAGFIGSEVASSARKRGLDVTVIESLPTPLANAIGEVTGSACAALHERNGTDLRCGITVEAVEGDNSVERVRLSDGAVLPADLVVIGVGAVPATNWLSDSGVTLSDGIVCDETLFTGVPGIYAAGDATRWHNPEFDRGMRLEHWTSAAEQGGIAARNALDPSRAKTFSTVPYFWSDWYEDRIQFVGIPGTDEVRIVDSAQGGEHFVALYREGNRLVGAMTMNRPGEIMKYRKLIKRWATWTEGLRFASSRRAA